MLRAKRLHLPHGLLCGAAIVVLAALAGIFTGLLLIFTGCGCGSGKTYNFLQPPGNLQ